MPVTTRRRPLALVAAMATATAVGATVLATAPTAAAAETPLSGYELTWGIKESYRTYVVRYAAGSFTATDGASQADDNGVFTFTGGRGTYDRTTHTVRLSFKGTLTAESTRHGFKRTLSDLKYDSGTGVLTADLTEDDGETRQDVPFAEVAAPTGQNMTDLATTLTEEAGAFLGSPSYAGAAGDPLSVVKKQDTTSPSPSPDESEPSSPEPPTSPGSPTAPSSSSSPIPSKTGSTSPKPTSSASRGTKPPASSKPSTSTAPAPAKGDIVDGRLTWGVKESFRSYVVGPVAKGRITTSNGASQASGNGVFTFTGATGTYDTKAGTLSAAFKGSVNFKGHQGEGDGGHGLDLTLGNIRATLNRGSGKLTADVDRLGEKSQNVVLADLKAGSTGLTAVNDVITLNKVTATLTEAGAKAFGGFYDKGTALDPVNLSVALTEDAELPSGNGIPGGGSGTGGSGTSGGSGGIGSTTGGTGGIGDIGSTTGGIGGSMAATGSDVPVAALGTAAAAAVAAGAGVLFAMRGRRTTQ